MATIIKTMKSDVSVALTPIGSTDHYKCVYDYPDEFDDWNLAAIATGAEDELGIQALNANLMINISSVTLIARCIMDDPASNGEVQLSFGVSPTAQSLTTSYAEYTEVFERDSAPNVKWTPALINANNPKIRLQADPPFYEANCSQFYMTIDCEIFGDVFQPDGFSNIIHTNQDFTIKLPANKTDFFAQSVQILTVMPDGSELTLAAELIDNDHYITSISNAQNDTAGKMLTQYKITHENGEITLGRIYHLNIREEWETQPN